MIQGMYQLITLISKSLSLKMYNFLHVTCNYCNPLSPREITTILNLMNHCLHLFNHFYHLCLNARRHVFIFYILYKWDYISSPAQHYIYFLNIRCLRFIFVDSHICNTIFSLPYKISVYAYLSTLIFSICVSW